MSAIKTIHEINGTFATQESIMNAINIMDTNSVAVLDRPAIAHIYGESHAPEGCGRTGCVRIACGADDFRDYGSGFNEGGRAYDDNLDPRDLAPMPARPMTEDDCAYMRGIHDGWLNAQWHADMLCVIDDEPDTGEEAWLGRDDVSFMDNDEPEPGLGEGFGPDDECAYLEHYDDTRRYAEGVYEPLEPEDVRG